MIKPHCALLSMAFYILLLVRPAFALTDTTEQLHHANILDHLQQDVTKLLTNTPLSSEETLTLLNQLTIVAYETRLNIRLEPDEYSESFIHAFEELNQKIWTNPDLFQLIESIPLNALTLADKHTINRAKTLFSRYGYQANVADIHLLPTGTGKIRKILQYPDPKLHRKAQRVTEFNDALQTLIDDMLTTMYQAKGVGLAATQIGVHQQVVVMDVSITQNQPMVFINPKVTPIGDTTLSFPQGCLSVKDTMDIVTRPKKVRIEALDRYGNAFVVEDEKLIAVCIQHELDHLNGVLFIQHLSKEKQKNIATRLGYHCDICKRPTRKVHRHKRNFVKSH